ncbi:hypothetical protein CH373_00635 [Leptospira perolatii]|nr:hypothetical protein CH373_00635 [Leptospira perolatii]
MKISDGVQKISFPEQNLTYVKPVLNRNTVHPVEQITPREIRRHSDSLNLYSEPGKPSPKSEAVQKGRFFDTYA